MTKRLKNFMAKQPVHAEFAAGPAATSKTAAPKFKLVNPSFANMSGFATTDIIRD